MPSLTVPGHRIKKDRICNVREGDLLLVNGEVSTIAATAIASTGTHYIYTVYGSDGNVLLRGPAIVPVNVCKPIPQVGDGATQSVGSDAYPATVIAVSRTGHEITIQRDAVHYVSGSFQTNDAVYDIVSDPDGSILKLRWSAKFGCYRTSGGTRVYTGHRRYHQDPSF